MLPFGPGQPTGWARPTNLVMGRHERTRADTGHGHTGRCPWAGRPRAGARGLGGESWVIALIQLTKTPDITSTAAPGVGARAHVSDDGREQHRVLGDVMPRGWAQTCPDRSRRTSSDGRSHGEMPEAGGLRQRERAEDGGAAAALSRWDVVDVLRPITPRTSARRLSVTHPGCVSAQANQVEFWTSNPE